MDFQTIVLVTGANQGLGFEMVKSLSSRANNYTILLAARDISKGKDAASSLDSSKFASNTTVEPIELDISSDDSIETAVKHIKNTYSRLDVLVNNAGIAYSNGSNTTRASYHAILDTNITSTAMLTDACAPLLKQSSFPRIVIMSSTLGSITTTLDEKSPFYGYDTGAYGISKAGLNMLGALLTTKYAKDGFKVNIICPGYRPTNLNNYNKAAQGTPSDGAVEAVRVIQEGKEGKSGVFTSTEVKGIPW